MIEALGKYSCELYFYFKEAMSAFHHIVHSRPISLQQDMDTSLVSCVSHLVLFFLREKT